MKGGLNDLLVPARAAERGRETLVRSRRGPPNKWCDRRRTQRAARHQKRRRAHPLQHLTVLASGAVLLVVVLLPQLAMEPRLQSVGARLDERSSVVRQRHRRVRRDSDASAQLATAGNARLHSYAWTRKAKRLSRNARLHSEHTQHVLVCAHLLPLLCSVLLHPR